MTKATLTGKDWQQGSTPQVVSYAAAVNTHADFAVMPRDQGSEGERFNKLSVISIQKCRRRRKHLVLVLMI